MKTQLENFLSEAELVDLCCWDSQYLALKKKNKLFAFVSSLHDSWSVSVCLQRNFCTSLSNFSTSFMNRLALCLQLPENLVDDNLPLLLQNESVVTYRAYIMCKLSLSSASNSDIRKLHRSCHGRNIKTTTDFRWHRNLGLWCRLGFIARRDRFTTLLQLK